MKYILVVVSLFMIVSLCACPKNYGSVQMTNASEIGIACTVEAVLKRLNTGDKNDLSIDKIRVCIKEEFLKNGWKYEINIQEQEVL